MLFHCQFLLAVTLDLLFGDPEWFPHPVRIIGKICLFFEKILRPALRSPGLAGGATVAAVLGAIGVTIYLLLAIASQIASWLGATIAIFLLYTCVAARDLIRHSRAVYALLRPQVRLDEARVAVGRIVGRDTSQLDETGIARACVETVAENMADGITAPLFFAVLGSFCAAFLPISAICCAALAAMLYKAVNTMDSMFGYKNEQYLYFGRTAAKLDDYINWLPARLSGFCVIIAAFLGNFDYRKAVAVFFRDRLKHTSPNAGHTEAAVAGALSIRLGGPSVYFGNEVVKPYLCEEGRAATAEDIRGANMLVLSASAVFVIILLACRGIIA